MEAPTLTKLFSSTNDEFNLFYATEQAGSGGARGELGWAQPTLTENPGAAPTC
jgi:hypothetical protein